MIQTGFESRVKVQQIIESQLPSFILDESPNASEFLKQYYISQEYQGGPIDIAENLDQYLKLDNLTPEVIVGSTSLSANITDSDTDITVDSTKGFPDQYGLFKIDNEIITYTGKTATTFTGCIRGFSGITAYHQNLDQEELVFTKSNKLNHTSGSKVENLSSLFLKEFYEKIKYTIVNQLQKTDFTSGLNVGTFLKEAKSFYTAKGTDESFRILFKVLYNEDPKVINLEKYLIKPSYADYVRREIAITEVITENADIGRLVGQTIRKTTDDQTSASVSSVEPFTRNNDSYYKISLFVGYDEPRAVEGNFVITPNTKTTLSAPAGSNVITVDSTIGFAESGTIISEGNIITYTEKSINQFFGCSGVVSDIQKNVLVRSDETYYGYENGDLTKKVEFRILGVLSDFVDETVKVAEGDEIGIAYLGDNVGNPQENKTYKQIFANSWIYNTAAKYSVNSLESNYQLASNVDKSSLKVGDRVELIERDTETITESFNSPYVDEILDVDVVGVAGSFATNSSKKYDLRRIINTAQSTGVSLEYNSNITSDILNLYTDKNDYAYVASNSLPSSEIFGGVNNYRYNITKQTNGFTINSEDNLFDFDTDSLYATIGNSINVPFITGDAVYYSPSDAPLVGLETGLYYVQVLNDPKKIRLYLTNEIIGGPDYLKFSAPEPDFGSHLFVLYSQKSNEIGVQKIFKKFPLNTQIKGSGESTIPGTTSGMLINGVEISNYKSLDKIYYGPLESIDVLNGGSNYDVINPPFVSISTSLTNALAQPVLSGKIDSVFVDAQEYNIDKILSVDISGGNGSGAVLEPVLVKRYRDVSFDGRLNTNSGGIGTATGTITFLSDHNFQNGQEVIYNSNGNSSLVIGSGTTTLLDRTSYFVRVENNTTISLFESLSDYNSGSNKIGFSTGTEGTHKFQTITFENTISDIKVIDGGSGYTNRKLIVSQSGISTVNDSINFVNHGFKTGELITYNFETAGLSGLSTSNQYFVIKVNDDSFRICDAGIGGTITTNFDREKYIKLSNTGSGYQYFSYPDIVVSIKYNPVGFSTTTQVYQNILATPKVKGSITDLYLYEKGTGYGSSIINFEKNPTIELKIGKNASLTPQILNGMIDSVVVQSGGVEYYSIPDLIVTDPSGAGSGANLRAVVTNGSITDVKVVNTGIGYSTSSYITVKPSGSGAFFRPKIRSLTINNTSRFGSELLIESTNKLKYTVSGYFESLRNSLGESDANSIEPKLSGIIGWAYDGNPIYGPFGYSDPDDENSIISLMSSGYTSNVSNIEDRPSVFAEGFFVEDYKFTNSGTLDDKNGRFAKTREFPNGIYAYVATVNSAGVPVFPYFIGNDYQSKILDENIDLNQSFDFQSSNLLRNTFPYKVSDVGAGYDYFTEIDDISKQRIVVESVYAGSVDGFEIISAGSGYSVGDKLNYSDTNTGGGGLDVQVSSIKGKQIFDIKTDTVSYNDSILVWNYNQGVDIFTSSDHILDTNNYVTISGLSTNLSELNGIHKITVSKNTTKIISDIESATSIGGTEIYVSTIPEKLYSGDNIGIGTETLKVLNIFRNKNVLRVERGVTGTSHAVGTAVTYKSNRFTIPQNVNYFESERNHKIYFNPYESVGFGTIAGISTSSTFSFGPSLETRSIPSKSIYIENHPFKTNQQIVYTLTGNNVAVSTDGINLIPGGLPSSLFVINKGRDLIGLKTTIDSSELFFHENLNVDDDRYLFETSVNQITANVSRIKSTVSVSTFHNLSVGDSVSITAIPNLTIGIGTTTFIKVSRDTLTEKILIDPIGFSSAGVSTSNNSITILNHGLVTGDKINYSAEVIPEGLYNGEFYVYKLNEDTIKLCETYIDSVNNPPTVIGIGSTGGVDQTLSKINPQLKITKNNNVVFNLTDSSVSGYNLKIYYDSEFKNEFVSSGSTDVFTVETVGTALTFTYLPNQNIPDKLYYSLEKSGSISTSDKEVKNYSEISFSDSDYNGSYNIISVGNTTFDFVLKENPERLSYSLDECDTLEYTTNSKTANGPIHKLKVLSGGVGYKKLPALLSVDSVNGQNAVVIPKSSVIGSLKDIKIINDQFEYPSDPTLKPVPRISPSIIVKDANTISSVDVTYGGNGYFSSPDVIVVNESTGKIIDAGLLTAELSGSSIQFINVESEPKGIPDESVKIVTINNSNGITVQTVQSSSSGIFTCSITKPSTEYQFNAGDKVFVEGIQRFDQIGSGFNSEDYGYKLFDVQDYTTSSPYDLVTINVSGLTTNTGIAKTVQEGSGTLINGADYPIFNVNAKKSSFLQDERLLSFTGNDLDLLLKDFDGFYLKVEGNYDLQVGEIVKGGDSGSLATIDSIQRSETVCDVSYSTLRNVGWNDNVGELNLDSQVTPDNDYYQTLSYTIKSSKEYAELESPVFSILHTAGLKNFADTVVQKTAPKIGIGSDDNTIYLYDLIDEKRVDTIYNFDFARDYNVLDGSSKLIQLQNKRLVDYFFFDSTATRVLTVDDFTDQFSYFEDEPNPFVNIQKLNDETDYYNYLIRVTDRNNTEIQFTEIVILNDGTNDFFMQKGEVFNSESSYGTYDIYTDDFEDSYFRFIPNDPFDTDYELKIITNTFTSSSAGVGTTSLGFIDLISSIGIATPGITTSLSNLDANSIGSLYANVQVIDDTSGDMNFVELYVTHDGTNTFMSEYYGDSEFETSSYSGNFIGTFNSDISGGILSLSFTNTGLSKNTVKAKLVGFGSTTIVGVGQTYRFKSGDQFDGSERSVIYQSNYAEGVGSATLVSVDKLKFNAIKSLVEVSIGSTKAVHNVMMIQDTNDAYVQQAALLSVNGTSVFDDAIGIGTFGVDNSGSTFDLTFTSDPEYAAYNLEITSFSQCFYEEIDIINDPLPLEYGDVSEASVDLEFYNSINGDRINRTNFELLSNKVRIFKKVFNPQNSSILNPGTGTFNIKNHFFRNNEELVYTPKSSVVGLATTAMTYDDGSITNLLPSKVFAIVTNEDSFQISTSKGGSAITFTDLGGGNIHQFEMLNKNNKTIVVLDDLIQHPLSFSGFSHQLSDTLGAGTSIFALSGIASIGPADILNINGEYMNVVNVGLGTSSIGPITNDGSFSLVQTERGFVGTSASSHPASSKVDIYRGAFNIVDNQIHFTFPPRGNPQIDKTPANLDYETSTFNARVFLRSDYTNNKIYDDISNDFNGIGRTFTMKVGGGNTSGIGTEGSSGIVLINGIFQQPSTINNPFGNFDVIETTSPYPGITTFVFSGITKPNEDPIVYYSSEQDININETPRGGIIISYGSTTGLGFAPLVGASVTAIVGGGVITGITTSGVVRGSYGSGYNGLSGIGISVYEEGHSGTAAEITASIGVGGTLSFNIVNGGTGYTSPSIFVSPPSYENLSVVGVSRFGIGATTTTGIGLSISLKVGPIVGSSTTYFGVTDFDITKLGYSFERGDVFKPVGLVTDASLSSPLEEFEITVLDTYSDKFCAWDFGKLDFIDSIADLQDGSRVAFPLFYNGELRSFEKDLNGDLNLANNLLIFINGILQQPGLSYTFDGGTTFQFTTPPKKDDNISIYFYKGLDSDVASFNVNTTIEKGDIVQKDGQDQRTVSDLSFSDRFETEIYSGSSVDDSSWKTLDWTKQKVDKKVNGEVVSKSRDSLKALIFPTSKLIGDLSVSDTELFVDNIEMFQYENPDEDPFDLLVVSGVSTDPSGNVEYISNLRFINGLTGNIIGIASTSIPSLAIEFTLEDILTSPLQIGYPIYITDTRVGNGVRSTISTDSEVVGIGTIYLDNIYYISDLSVVTGNVGIITCRVDTNSNLVGIDTTGIVGKYSWGRLSNAANISRTNPISIGVTGRVVSGLSTYPTVMRRLGDTTLRATGAIYEI